MTRSLKHLLQIVEDLDNKGVALSRFGAYWYIHSNRAMFRLRNGSHFQMERELKSERAAAGRDAAKARGKTGEDQGQTRRSLSKLEFYTKLDQTASEVCLAVGKDGELYSLYCPKTRKYWGKYLITFVRTNRLTVYLEYFPILPSSPYKILYPTHKGIFPAIYFTISALLPIKVWYDTSQPYRKP